MTDAESIVACDDCRPDERQQAIDVMTKVIAGELSPEKYLCETHIEAMDEAAEDYMESQW